MAGPDKDERGTPVGTGYVALSGVGKDKVAKVSFRGDRNAIRRRFAYAALDLLRRRLR